MTFERPQRVLLLLTFLSWTAAVPAKDIYVSVTQGNDQNSGSSAGAALRTIAAAVGLAQPGDTVWVSPGQYQESLVPLQSGTKAQPITFKRLGQGSAVIVQPSAGTNRAAIYVNGVTDIVIDGIDANGGKPAPDAALNAFVTVSNSSRIVIRNGTFAQGNGWEGIGVSNGSTYVTIEDNQVDMVGHLWPAKGWGGNGEGIAASDGNPTHVLVQRNRISHCGHDLLTIGGQFNVAQDNYLDNDWTDVQGAPAGYRNAVVIGSNNLFQRNSLAHSGPGPAPLTYPTLLRVEGSNNIVRQNILTYAYNQAIQSQAGSWTANGSGDHIYNNTIYQAGGPAWEEVLYTGYTRGNDVFQNNLAVNTRLNPSTSNFDNDVVIWANDPTTPTASSSVIGNLIVPAGGKSATLMLGPRPGSVPLNKPGTAVSAYVFANLVGPAPTFAHAPAPGNTSAAAILSTYQLSAGSAGLGQGTFLTTITATGNSASLPVKDAGFFTDGFGLVPGDMVKLQGGSQPIQVTHVDYAARVVTLAQSVAYSAGQGLSLSYAGAAPDIGLAAILQPSAPQGVRVGN